MVFNPVTLVLPIGLNKTIHHVGHTRGPVHWQRLCMPTLQPTLQHQLAQTTDVIGMEMGQEYGFDVTQPKAHAPNLTGTRGSCVKHQEALARHHQSARARAQIIGKGRTRTAQTHMQTIGQVADGVGIHFVGGDAARHLQGNGALEPPQHRRTGARQKQQPNHKGSFEHASSMVEGLWPGNSPDSTGTQVKKV